MTAWLSVPGRCPRPRTGWSSSVAGSPGCTPPATCVRAGTASTSPSSTAATTTCSSRCCTRSRPAPSLRARSRSPCARSFATSGTRRCCWARRSDIDADKREVILSDGGPIPYDTLIVATGAHHSYFGHDEWAPYAQGLKTIDDAIDMRRRILIAFEAAEREADPVQREAWMTFVIVGGGPTGVELAGALGEIANDTLRADFRSIRSQDARIYLVEALDRILPTYPPDRSASAKGQLERLGVVVRTKTRVVGIDDQCVHVEPDAGTPGGDPVAHGAVGRGRARSVVRRARSPRPPVPRPTAAGASGSGATSPSPATRRSSSSATPRSSRGSATARRPASPRAGSRAGATRRKAVLARLDGRPVKPFRYSRPWRRRGHRAPAGRDRHPVDGPVRTPGRVHGLAPVARDPHRVPHRVRKPDRRLGPLGVVVPDPGTVDAADHGVPAGPPIEKPEPPA